MRGVVVYPNMTSELCLLNCTYSNISLFFTFDHSRSCMLLINYPYVAFLYFLSNLVEVDLIKLPYIASLVKLSASRVNCVILNERLLIDFDV